MKPDEPNPVRRLPVHDAAKLWRRPSPWRSVGRDLVHSLTQIDLGFGDKVYRAEFHGRRVVSQPVSVSELTMITGVGRPRMSFSRKVKPSIFGISTSKVSTSGLSALIFSLAT